VFFRKAHALYTKLAAYGFNTMRRRLPACCRPHASLTSVRGTRWTSTSSEPFRGEFPHVLACGCADRKWCVIVGKS
jgi:hypothetical protein